MLNRLEEIALVTRCAAGDDRAFEAIVNEHSAAIRNFLFRLTAGDASLTDNLAQETFIKAYTNMHLFKALSRLRTWLFRIAYNEFVDYARKRREERMPENYDTEIIETSATDGEMTRIELRHDIKEAMKSLTDAERTLIALFYFEDLPIKEICKITSLPSGTVKCYLSRAKSKLATTLIKQDIRQ